MSGKLIIHGLEQAVAGGRIDILLDYEKVGAVDKRETVELPITQNCQLTLKCGINPLKGKADIQDGMRTEIQCKYNRLTGAIQAQVLSVTPYQAEQDIHADEHTEEQLICKLDGGGKDILYVYGDHVVIRHRGALNALSTGIKGDKTIYYNDITSVQYKKPGLVAGYIQFSIPGGNESKGGVLSAISDENTIPIKSDSAIMKQAEEVMAFLNRKIREAKTGGATASTVVQQLSSADELKKFKELLDMGVITQEEFDAKKKQLLGL